MATLHPYLNFQGNTEEAFNFYKHVFGGEFASVIRFRDTPESSKIAEGDRDKIMHIALPIGTTLLMGTDALESMGQQLKPGNNFHLTYSANSQQDADERFAALSKDGFTMLPMQTQFWGAYFGMCTDKYGVQWMVSWDPKQSQ